MPSDRSAADDDVRNDVPMARLLLEHTTCVFWAGLLLLLGCLAAATVSIVTTPSDDGPIRTMDTLDFVPFESLPKATQSDGALLGMELNELPTSE